MRKEVSLFLEENDGRAPSRLYLGVAQTFLSVQQNAHSSVPAQTGMSVPPLNIVWRAH